MSHFDEPTYAMFVDRELGASEVRAVETHLATCAPCRQLVAALAGENEVLAGALQAEAPASIPGAGSTWRRAAAWTAVGAAILGGLRQLVPAGAAGGPDWVDLVVAAALFLARHAATLDRLVTTLAVVTMAVLALAGILHVVREGRGHRAPAIGLLALGLALGWPAAAAALETRIGTRVTVAAPYRVGGTLVAAADLVEIDGTVEGDLIVAARSLEIRGAVQGNVVFAGKEAIVRGTVDGSAYTLAGRVEIPGHVTRTLYGLNRFTTVTREGRVEGDATLAGRDVGLEGRLGRSVWVWGRTVRVTGEVARHLTARAHALRLSGQARVGGDVVAHVLRGEDLEVGPEVAIGGRREARVAPAGSAVYAEPRTYFWLATGLVGAVVVGCLGFLAAPRFCDASVRALGAWWRSLGLGAAVLVGAPIAMVLAAVTLVGLPVALLGLGLYLAGLYAAKIVVGLFLGRAILRSAGTRVRDVLPALGMGLLIVAIAVRIPVAGGILHLAVLCLGVGALASTLARTIRHARGS
jgi:cytoskeletal protein CcmA (bactofilin family)